MTTRERAIEKMARAMYARLDLGPWETETWEITDEMKDAAMWALDALLAPETIPCPDCLGVGYKNAAHLVTSVGSVSCSTCHGEGSVPGEPLLIARDRLERAEYLDVERMAQDGRAQFPAGDTAMTRRAAEPLYRLRDVNEGEEV